MGELDNDISSISKTLAPESQASEDGLSMNENGLDDSLSSFASVLIGRTREKSELLKAYQLVGQTGHSQVAFVHGESGQGKTLLVDTLREEVCASNRGYFCAGKFFQGTATQEPYSAIMTAFSDLCDLVVQSEDFDDDRRRQIRESLALDGPLLARAINLSPFMVEEAMEGSPQANNPSFARFKTACKAFLLAMPSENHPVVLFIDDIQWMDEGSEKLIDMFIQDKEITNVFFILSYRDEEKATVERTLLQSSAKGSQLTDLQLTNLDASSVHQMVCSHLGSSSSELEKLSDLVFQRTHGNPFFVTMFLEVIQHEEMLTVEGSSWRFDCNEIRSSIMISENVAELLSQKVQRLSIEIRDVLVVASLLGYSFSELILLKVAGSVTIRDVPHQLSHEQLGAYLAQAVDEGFIEKIECHYSFTHDKLQSAFQGLIGKKTQEHIHLRIGEVYLGQTTGESMIYGAAVHLNNAPGFLEKDDQRVKLARVNLQASRYCQQKSAFDEAANLLHKGIELLDATEKWSDKFYDLAFEMTELLSRMLLFVGDFDGCRKASTEAMLHANSTKRKLTLLMIDIECHMANNELEASVATAIYALSELGVKWPKKISMRHVLIKVIKLNMLMARKTSEDILGLPPVGDENMEVAVRLLSHICNNSLLVNSKATGVYAGLSAMDLTLKHGLSKYSAAAVAVYGSAVLFAGNVNQAYTLGELALQLVERSQSREADGVTSSHVNSVLLHWKRPLCDLRNSLFETARAGFQIGDVAYGTFCFHICNEMDWIMGSNLKMLESSLRDQYNRLNDLCQNSLLLWIRPCMQAVTNLQSDSMDWSQLSLLTGDDSMDFEKQLMETNSANIIAGGNLIMKKLFLTICFGFYSTAAALFDKYSSVGKLNKVSYAYPIWCWGAGVANYEHYRKCGKRKYLKKARKFKKELKRLDGIGCPNTSVFLGHHELKETSLTWRAGKDDDALLGTIGRAIEKLADRNPSYVEAMANVDAGMVCARMGRHLESKHYFRRGKHISLNRWGATAVCQWIESKDSEVNGNYNVVDNFHNSLVGSTVRVETLIPANRGV